MIDGIAVAQDFADHSQCDTRFRNNPRGTSYQDFATIETKEYDLVLSDFWGVVMKMIFGEPLSARRERISKAYGKKFRQVPFAMLDIGEQDKIEAFELMEAALILGKPLADNDIDRLGKYYRDDFNLT